MYVCLDCGQFFEQPKSIVETHGLETGPYEKRIGCPHCGGAFDQVIECDDCGAEIPEELVIRFEGQRLCPECWEKVKDI